MSDKRLQGPTGVYKGLQRVTSDYRGLKGGKRGLQRLQRVATDFKGLQEVTKGYKGLQGV